MCPQASTMTRLVHFIMYFIFVLTGLIADTANACCIPRAQDVIDVIYSPCKRGLHFLQKSPRVTYMCSQASTTTRLTYLLFSRAKYYFPLQIHLKFSAHEPYASIHVLTGLFGDTVHVCSIPLHTMLYSPLQKKPTFPAKEPNTNIHVLISLTHTSYVCSILPHNMLKCPANEPYISRKRARH